MPNSIAHLRPCWTCLLSTLLKHDVLQITKHAAYPTNMNMSAAEPERFYQEESMNKPKNVKEMHRNKMAASI